MTDNDSLSLSRGIIAGSLAIAGAVMFCADSSHWAFSAPLFVSILTGALSYAD